MYGSKCLSSAAANYSVAEFEFLGTAVNITLDKHLLVKVDFDCTVDYRLEYIL